MQTPPIFDGHNDTLLRIYSPKPGAERSFFERSDSGHIDLPRAREGGLGGGFFAIFVPTPKDQESQESFSGEPSELRDGYAFPPAASIAQPYALNFALDMMELLFQIEEESDQEVKVVRRVDEMQRCLQNGTLAAICHFEGAEPLTDDLAPLRVLYQAGLRSIGLVWSRSNSFAHGVPFQFPGSPDTGPGLTDAGKELVRACNQMGILVDLSHLNEKGFWDVAELSNAPLVATHSGVHAICPSTRNLTDDQLDAVGRSNGVIGVNFHVGFLRPDGQSNQPTTVGAIADHVDYMVQRIGIDHVALGSDFDGATMPTDMKDAAGLPLLMEELRRRGYDAEGLQQIAHGNWLRVLEATWR